MYRRHNEHFLLHCPRFLTQRRDLFDLVSGWPNVEIMRLSSKELSNLLLYGGRGGGGGTHVKILTGMLVLFFFGFEIWPNPIFLGWEIF